MSATADATHICGLLRDAYGDRDTAKHAARAAGVSHRTTERWVAGTAEPRASVLLRMIARCERMRHALERKLDARLAAEAADQRATAGGAVPAVARAAKGVR